MKYLWIPAALAACAAAIFLLQPQRPTPDVLSLSYSRGGTALGDSYTVELSDYRFTETLQPSWNEKAKRKTYRVDAAFYEALDRLLEEGDVRSWTDLPDNDRYALDGFTVSFTVTFADGTVARYNSSKLLSQEGMDVIGQVLTLFENAK
ncbi:MAG: hypothetical protein HUJ80_02075 [Firmicutes bacterium]|nr:hypothetical protein [Bacillota bacterium]